jgi:integrase
MRQQKGYLYRRCSGWFLRVCEDVKQPDGTIARKLVSKRLPVDYGGNYTTKKSVQPFVDEILAPVNSGLLNPEATMLVSDFIEKIYLPRYVEKNLRPASIKQYTDVYENHLKPRLGKLTLRSFRTVHGEQMLAQIAEQAKLGRSSLRHCKAFLSGCFKQAMRLGILSGTENNPVQNVSIPRVPEAEQDTYAYSLPEIKSMLAVLPEPARTIVLTAAFSGLRKSELRGLTWDSFDGKELSVTRSAWNKTFSEPKTKRSRSPIPVVRPLAEALEAHRLRAGALAQATLPIFQAGNGQPLNLDNIARRVVMPALSPCAVCKMQEDEHLPDGHAFQRDSSLPLWHGWHAFRRGLATNLHTLGVADKDIQAILRHSNIGLTMNVYVKSVNESQVSALDSLSEKFETCSNLAANQTRVIQ